MSECTHTEVSTCPYRIFGKPLRCTVGNHRCGEFNGEAKHTDNIDAICRRIAGLANATPADFAAIRRALSAVDPVTAALERLARAYHTAAWEGDVIAPSEVVDAWVLLDAGWTGEESEEEND